jgi:TPR repeat protein
VTDEDLNSLCDQARDLWHAGEAEAAVNLWTRAADAGSARAVYNLGYVAESRGDRPEAERLYTIAASADPPFPLAIYNLSVFAIADQKLDLAVELSEKAAALGVAMAALNRGQIASWASDITTAKVWWERAAELGDDGSSAYNLGIHATDEGDRASARRWFERSAELGYPDGMNNFGVLLRQEGDLAGSMEMYERAAEAGSTLAMGNLAELAESTGRMAEAEQWLQRAADAGDEAAAAKLTRIRSHPSPTAQAQNMPQPQRWSLTPPASTVNDAPAGTTGLSAFCNQCGARFQAEDKFCSQCGATRE